jgi:protein-disulfide isomerase
LFGAAVAGVGLIGASRRHREHPWQPQARREAAAVEALLGAVAQHGVVLGSAESRAVVIEFIDPGCQRCWRVARRVLPMLLSRYLRPRRIRLELWVVSSLDSEFSTRAAQAAYAAGAQDRLWSFLAALNASDGARARGGLSGLYLRQIARAVPRLDVDRMLRDARHSGAVADQLLQARLMARHLGVDATPALLVANPHSGRMDKLELGRLEDHRVASDIDAALGR